MGTMFLNGDSPFLIMKNLITRYNLSFVKVGQLDRVFSMISPCRFQLGRIPGVFSNDERRSS